ncbi:hypothetical protein JCM33374_g4619 [Metschnikowia sp. JCM 33374]|nr:hypothetical protein JCM33374_g4619 [Metschnikowia sp. JCM 33374]
MVSFKTIPTLILASLASAASLNPSHFSHDRSEMVVYKLEGLDVNSVSSINLVEGKWFDHDSPSNGRIVNVNSTYTGYEEGNGFIVSTVGAQPIGSFGVSSDEDLESELSRRFFICCSFTACGKQIDIYVK